MPSVETQVRRALRSLDAKLDDPRLDALGERPGPIDIACELCRAMEAGRFKRRGVEHVQTIYDVLLSPHDHARFDDRARELVATLKDVLVWWAREHAYEMPGELRVRLVADEQMRPGQLSIEAGLRMEEAAKLGRARRRGGS